MVRGVMVAFLGGCGGKGSDTAVSGETAAGDTAEAPSYSSLDGRLEYKIAVADPSTTQCDLFWVFLGAPATPCPDCAFAFTLDMVYDAASSDNAAGCVSDDATASFSWTVGYDAGYADTGVPVLWLYDPTAATWAPAFDVALDPASGALDFHTSFAKATDQGTENYYSVYGEGTLQRASSARARPLTTRSVYPNPTSTRKLPVARSPKK